MTRIARKTFKSDLYFAEKIIMFAIIMYYFVIISRPRWNFGLFVMFDEKNCASPDKRQSEAWWWKNLVLRWNWGSFKSQRMYEEYDFLI